MERQFDAALYHVMVVDRATGRSHAVNEDAPIEGRYKAEEQARAMERSNRDPNLQYTIERCTSRRKTGEELTPEALLTHKFPAYQGRR